MFDEQVVRLDREIAELADAFVLLRLVNMRGVDLRTFEFDYDLTWAGFFLNDRGHVYGRYGGRDEGGAEDRLSLTGLKNAMKNALAAYQASPDARPESPGPVETVEAIPAASRIEKNQCIHCHQVYDLRRETLQSGKKWTRDMVWVYPPPKNVGIELEVDSGNVVRSVEDDSPAWRAGMRPGDVLLELGGRPVASFADAQFALHHAPAEGELATRWERAGKPIDGRIPLASGWRQSDISWRGSMWGLSPTASVYGKDLTAEEKKRLGLGEKRLAFYQGDFVPPPAREAGVRARDVILGINGLDLEMNMLQFNAYVRLQFKVGDRIVYNVIRGDERLELPSVLAGRDW